MPGMGFGFGLGLHRRASGSGASASVSAQTADFGAETLAGDGGFKPEDENGSAVSLTSVDDQTGTTRTWSISDGRLVADGTPGVDDGQVITCGYSGGTVDLTVRSIAEAANVASDADVDAFFAQSDATIAGKTLLAQRGYSVQAMQFMSTTTVFGAYDAADLDTLFSAAWTLYFDIYHHQGSERTVYSQRRDPAFGVQMHNGAIRVSNLSAWSTGTTTYATGRLRAVVRWDGTTLTASVKPVGGATTEEINEAKSFSNSSNQKAYWGAFPPVSGFDPAVPLRGLIYDGALWSAKLTDTQRDELLDGADPADYPTDLEWHPSTAEGNAGTGIVPLRRFVEPSVRLYDSTDTTSGGWPDNFVVMRDPETGAPVLHDSKYWAALNEVTTEDLVTLATSTDLINWTHDSTVLTSSTGDDDNITAGDLIYLGNVAGGHDPFFLYTVHRNEAGDDRIELRTSSDMLTWTEDATSPVFNHKVTGSSGPEDFRVVRANGAWYAAYEANQKTTGVAIGLAKNTNTAPTGAWANVNDELFKDPVHTAKLSFLANPAVTIKNGKVYCFYEGVSAPVNVTLGVVTDEENVEDNTSWKALGIIVARERETFPNCMTVEDDVIWHYNKYDESGDDHVRRYKYEPYRLYLSPAVRVP